MLAVDRHRDDILRNLPKDQRPALYRRKWSPTVNLEWRLACLLYEYPRRSMVMVAVGFVVIEAANAILYKPASMISVVMYAAFTVVGYWWTTRPMRRFIRTYRPPRAE